MNLFLKFFAYIFDALIMILSLLLTICAYWINRSSVLLAFIAYNMNELTFAARRGETYHEAPRKAAIEVIKTLPNN